MLQLQQRQVTDAFGEFPQIRDGVGVRGEGEAGAAHIDLPGPGRRTVPADGVLWASTPAFGMVEAPVDRVRAARVRRAVASSRYSGGCGSGPLRCQPQLFGRRGCQHTVVGTGRARR
ncbi:MULTISPECIES: hypothetical protein [Streptomyces]|uniref:Uncharacterized protein n=1 Tax=Streptomyces ramulosus TaxID=47762 RepID=A0ABW1FBT5_9ACTN